jgi:hypothetical protein
VETILPSRPDLSSSVTESRTSTADLIVNDKTILIEVGEQPLMA